MADHRPSLTKRASAVARVARGVPGNLPIPNPLERRTALGRVSQVTYATVPRVQDAVVNAGYRLFPDTRAALQKAGSDPMPPGATGGADREGSDPSSDAPEPSAEPRAFSRLTRGVHW